MDTGGRSRRGRRVAIGALGLLLLVAPLEAGATDEQGAVQLRAAPGRVWEVLTDLEAWQTIFPGVVRLQVEPIDEHRTRLRQVTRVLGSTAAYTLTATLVPEQWRLELVLDPSEPHDVESISVAWRVAALGDGRTTRVELRTRVASGRPVPGFVERRIVRRSVRQSLEALAEEVERRARQPLRLAGSMQPVHP